MTFSDNQLAQYKTEAEWAIAHGIMHPLWPRIIALIARLEAAEDALQSCKRYQYDDGLVIVEEPNVKLYEAWRKAAGK
jgi:hypothetical protein